MADDHRTEINQQESQMSEQKFHISADVIKRKHIEEDVGDLSVSETGRQKTVVLFTVEYQMIGHAKIFNIQLPDSYRNENDDVGQYKRICKK